MYAGHDVILRSYDFGHNPDIFIPATYGERRIRRAIDDGCWVSPMALGAAVDAILRARKYRFTVPIDRLNVIIPADVERRYSLDEI